MRIATLAAALQFTSSNIARIDFIDNGGDGHIIDNFNFTLNRTTVPEPASMSLFAIGGAALALVRELDAQKKLIVSICHGPWVLISAGIMKGRRCTSTPGIKDDLVNAGATWVDEPAVVDRNLVTARVPSDLPALMRAVLGALS